MHPMVFRSALRPVRPWPSRFSSLRFSTQPKTSDPLRILFCGSDEFSCASLEALHKEHQQNKELIQSIDVVVRPPKPTGRGNKIIRKLPLQTLAQELHLPVHERDTFTGWNMPQPINLIIAVSFGLFVPPRLLSAAKYGGLNVHPSLLPDLRGPSPLPYALLHSPTRPHTGTSLQTLSPHAFDAGTILSQTPPPGILIPTKCTFPQLLQILASPSADMLVNALRAGLHVPPYVDAGWKAKEMEEKGEVLVHAPKVKRDDRVVRWIEEDALEVERRGRALGGWGSLIWEEGVKKVVVLEGVDAWEERPDSVAEGKGRRVVLGEEKVEVEWWGDGKSVWMRMRKGGWLRVGSFKVEGKRFQDARSVLEKFSTFMGERSG